VSNSFLVIFQFTISFSLAVNEKRTHQSEVCHSQKQQDGCHRCALYDGHVADECPSYSRVLSYVASLYTVPSALTLPHSREATACVEVTWRKSL